METGEVFAGLARCDAALHIHPNEAAVLTERANLMLLLDDPWELAESGRRLASVSSPDARKVLSDILIRLYSHAERPVFINVGGGPSFHELGWLNLEAVQSPLNPHPFELSPTMQYPAEDSSIGIVYSSHCIEHLEAATVERVLLEARRVLKDDGFLILKIPDYDTALRSWQTGESGFFEDSVWGISSVSDTWATRGVEDSLDARAGMVFCGFWNDAYGGKSAHFGRTGQHGEGAYHGPPVLSRDEWNKIRGMTSPLEIATTLAARVRTTEPSFHFNHQIAWGRAELADLHKRCGFVVHSMDRTAVVRRFSGIPGIMEMHSHSLYCVASKDGNRVRI